MKIKHRYTANKCEFCVRSLDLYNEHDLHSNDSIMIIICFDLKVNIYILYHSCIQSIKI